MREEDCLNLDIVDIPALVKSFGCGGGVPLDPGGNIPLPEPPEPPIVEDPVDAVAARDGDCEPYPRTTDLVYKRVLPGFNLDGFPDWLAAPGSADPQAHYNVTLVTPNKGMVINGAVSTRGQIGQYSYKVAQTSHREINNYYQGIAGGSVWCGIPYNRSITQFMLTSGYQYEEPPPQLGGGYSITSIYEGFVATAQFLNIGDGSCEYRTVGAPSGYVYYWKGTTTWSPSWPPFTWPVLSVTKYFSTLKNTRITQCDELGFAMEGTLHPLTLMTGNGLTQGGSSFGGTVGGPTTPSPFFDPSKAFYYGTCPDAPSFGGSFRAFCVRE